jgi:hypothetical protein
MGNSITVDAVPSQINQILQHSPEKLSKITLKKELPSIINFHIKGWKFENGNIECLNFKK